MNFTHVALALGAAVFAVSLGVLGCLNSSEQDVGPSQYFAKIGDVQPYVEPYSRAYILTGSPVPTDLRTEKAPGSVRFYFMLHGSSIDEEFYTYDDSYFRYTGNRQEEFDPGIPLLKFPFTVGDKWDWSGKYRTGGTERDATAQISTSPVKLTTVGGAFSTVRVEVALSFESGGAERAKRKLTFWFAPKRGVVRREIQDGMTREPMPPKVNSESP